MRERISNVLRSAVYSIGASALMALLLAFMLSLHDQTHTVSLPVLLWAGLLLALCAVDEILAPRGLPLLVYGALNTALAAATHRCLWTNCAACAGNWALCTCASGTMSGGRLSSWRRWALRTCAALRVSVPLMRMRRTLPACLPMR